MMSFLAKPRANLQGRAQRPQHHLPRRVEEKISFLAQESRTWREGSSGGPHTHLHELHSPTHLLRSWGDIHPKGTQPPVTSLHPWGPQSSSTAATPCSP